MDDPHRYRTLEELPEYTAQCDSLIAKYSEGVIGRVLLGLLWGIATHPREYERGTWNMRVAKSASLGLTIPTFRIFFQIQNEGQQDEHILLCWIEESGTTEEVIDYLM
jgi:hypothetical protein